MTLEEARGLLRTLIRTIDKKVEFSASLTESEPPRIAVTMSLQKRQTTMVISEDELAGIEQDSIRRAKLRTDLKRAIDRMTFTPNHVVSTKMMRGTVVDGGFFRVQQGSRTGRR